MACIEKIYSVSALVGDGRCNANCSFCAGKYLRNEASDSPLYWKNYEAAIKLSARYGGWSLSLTGSGEPTCDPQSVTTALQKYRQCADQGAYFPNVNLFTNGILLGDEKFCDKWLPYWRDYGLTNVAVSVHSAGISAQAVVYHIDHYPRFSKIIRNVTKHGVGVRFTLLLRQGCVDNAKMFERHLKILRDEGADNITCWPVGNPDGTRNEYTPSRLGLWGIRWWLKRNAKLCHGHVWGGGVYDWDGAIVRMTSYVTPHDPKKDFVR